MPDSNVSNFDFDFSRTDDALTQMGLSFSAGIGRG